jgi:hypothetical protein
MRQARFQFSNIMSDENTTTIVDSSITTSSTVVDKDNNNNKSHSILSNCHDTIRDGDNIVLYGSPEDLVMPKHVSLAECVLFFL